jgi:polysaccharide biosynthesis/export protein
MHRSSRTVSILVLFFGLLVSGAIAGQEIRKTDPSQNTQEYRLGPDDVIDVFVWKEPDLSTNLTIRPDGKITMPLLNDLQASGKTAAQLQEEIKEKLSAYVTDPLVTVMIKQFNSFRFSVLGEVRTPGVYRVSQSVSVLDAIAMAGGFTEFAKRDHILVIRNSKSNERINVDLKKYLKDGKNSTFFVEPADVIYVK